LYELRQPYTRMAEQELRLELVTAARNARREREAILLVVDEAHLLNERLLEELRTATNIAQDGEPLVRVILCGQSALEERLADPDLAAFNQRIRAQALLEPLTRHESAEYVSHRLNWAGGRTDGIFSSEALQLICRCADGVPRCLNQLCDQSLILAAAHKIRPVDGATVRAALEELKRLPLHWIDPATVSLDDHRSVSVSADLRGEPTSSFDATDKVPADFDDDFTDGASFEFGAELPGTASGGGRRSPATSIPRAETIEFAASSPTEHRSSTGAGKFEEELVIDRYAMLDASAAGAFVAAAHPSQAPALRRTEAVTWDHGDDEQLDDEYLIGEPSDAVNAFDTEDDWQNVRPDRTLDEIVPMIDVALDTSDYDALLSEHALDGPGQYSRTHESEAASSSPASGYEGYHWDGHEHAFMDDPLWHVPLETATQHGDALVRVDTQAEPTIVEPPQYDVVLSENDYLQQTAQQRHSQSSDLGGEGTRRQYRQLFSELRRRRQQGK
jgi:hypothetical protein